MKNYQVIPTSRANVRQFIETHHYSGSINGVKSSYCFGLYDEAHQLIGAALFGEPATRGVKEHYGTNVLELRRLVLIDDTPKTTETWFLSRCLRWLKRHTDVDCVLSYADPEYGHTGVIYRAANFEFVGMTPPDKGFIYQGKRYHSRALRTKYKGDYKPFVKRLNGGKYGLSR